MDQLVATAAPLLSVVTVTFNSEDHIRGCLDSVARNAAEMSIEHIVIDNDSKDGTAAVVRAEFPQAVFIQNPENRGLTAANNQGQRMARGQYVIFLNPDTVVPDGTFRTLVHTMDLHRDIGVLAPRLVDERGKFHPGIMGHRAPTAWTLI